VARENKPVIAVTAGDPAGIGPEIVAHFFAGFQPAHSRAIVIGAPAILAPWAERFGWRMECLKRPDDISALDPASLGTVFVLDNGCTAAYPAGEHSTGGGRHAGKSVELACRLANSGLIDAIVTAPISKKSLSLAGYEYTGHTEMLADLLRAKACEMMMVYKQLRIVPLTRHLPLSEVSSHLDSKRVAECVDTVDRALRTLFAIAEPKIAFAALNPHAGDKGLLGREEITIVEPALARARAAGIDVRGPVPGDVVFQSVQRDEFDAYIATYHDQGLIPFKMIAQGRGVNVTIGMPIIRTSVDHGVAFDIAGAGTASTVSLEEAYSLAEMLSERQKKAAS
jgi:4-hydroxythreonine-4-phosphate dehydrogenase